MACFFPDFSDERLCFRRYHFHLPGCLLASEQGDQGLGTVPEVCVPAEKHRDEPDMGGGAEGREDRKAHVGVPRTLHAAFPFPQGFPARRMTTSCGHRLMSGATSVCWDTRLCSNGGLPTRRALTERTLTGPWSCPTAPVPERTMNGGFFLDAWGLGCIFLSSVTYRLGHGPFP